MREVDRIMIEELHIDLVQMMENAGRSLADLAIRLFEPATATVLAGPGGNGGGGLAAARHLSNRGVSAGVVLSRPAAEMTPVPVQQLRILDRMGLPTPGDAEPADVIVDALIGYGLQGDPRGRAAELIAWANAQPAPVVALDTPSGLNATTGRSGSPCVRATATLTLGLPKTGLLKAPQLVGRLFVADISVPPSVYRRLGIDVAFLFRNNVIVEIGG
jgi:NAD(P)H-hydrate epimerase